MKTGKSTLYLSAHPNTSQLVIPVVRLLFDNPETYLFARRVWTLLYRKTIPVDVSGYHGEGGFKSGFEYTLLKLFNPAALEPSDPIQTALRVLQDGGNVLMFPAGRVARRGEEEPWQLGVGRIVEQSLIHNIDPWICFFYVNGFSYECSKPRAASSFVEGKQMLPEKITAALRKAYFLRR